MKTSAIAGVAAIATTLAVLSSIRISPDTGRRAGFPSMAPFCDAPRLFHTSMTVPLRLRDGLRHKSDADAP